MTLHESRHKRGKAHSVVHTVYIIVSKDIHEVELYLKISATDDISKQIN